MVSSSWGRSNKGLRALLLVLQLIEPLLVNFFLLESLIKLQRHVLILHLLVLQVLFQIVDYLAQRQLCEIGLLGWIEVQVRHISLVNEAIDLLQNSRDGCLLGHMGCIAILATTLDHVLHPCFRATEVGLELDHILILFKAFLLKISFVDVQVEDDLEESLERCFGTLDAVKGIETHWLNAVYIKAFNLLCDLIDF